LTGIANEEQKNNALVVHGVGGMPEIHPSVLGNCEFAVGTVWGTLSGYALVFRLDGILELQSPTRLLLWESGARCRGGRILSMQTDGNLVIYNESRSVALWATETAGHPGAFLAIQEDGNAVIYTHTCVPIWATGTAGERRIEKPPEITHHDSVSAPLRLVK
jgi:hypothetical protein